MGNAKDKDHIEIFPTMTHHEVEVKTVIYREGGDEDPEEVLGWTRRKILEIGGVETDIIEQRDLYLSHPSRDFSKTDEAFRIRIQKEPASGKVDTILTYKGPKISKRSKTRVEKEVRIGEDNYREVQDLFGSLGFELAGTVEKTRQRFQLNEMEIALDIVPGLGIFIEVEMISDEVLVAEGKIIEFLKEQEWTEFERRSYLELLLG